MKALSFSFKWGTEAGGRQRSYFNFVSLSYLMCEMELVTSLTSQVVVRMNYTKACTTPKSMPVKLR